MFIKGVKTYLNKADIRSAWHTFLKRPDRPMNGWTDRMIDVQTLSKNWEGAFEEKVVKLEESF